MSNCFKTVRACLETLPALDSYLTAADKYYAHLPLPKTGGTTFAPEKLEEHIRLVNGYLQRLVDQHQLDIVIDTLIRDLAPGISVETGNHIKQLFVNVIVFHDFGKVNTAFQVKKMKNPCFPGRSVADSPIGTTHSSLGAFIYLARHLKDIHLRQKDRSLLLTCCYYLSYVIFKHHNSQLDNDSLHTVTFETLKARFASEAIEKVLSDYACLYHWEIPAALLKSIVYIKSTHISAVSTSFSSFSLYALCKLSFSLLTAADYLATHEYMHRQPIANMGILDKIRIEALYKSATTNEWLNEALAKRNYNKDIYTLLGKGYLFQNPRERNADNLNILRLEMAMTVIQRIRQYADQQLFYLEAPTGGGKSNLSFLATMELLKIHKAIYNKVFYVFPFTTLITQTFDSIKETLSLEDEEIIALHSKAGFAANNALGTEDDDYGADRLNYISHLFAQFPFSLLSHIRFFDILKTNEKESNYLLHRMANSIVVIDELQSYNPAHWDKIIYFIRQYARLFNIKFILMSATLPKLNQLSVIQDQVQDFVYLLPDAKALYFNNPNFSERVHFNFDLLQRKDLTLRELAEKVVAASRDYAQYDQGPDKPKGSVYTVVEFIHKQAATDFYKIVSSDRFFDVIFVLSGTILEHRRKEIIHYLKDKNNRHKKILLITTQVVEAGVDIDMDIGFKDRSIIDSDEQLAGRINRNAKKHHCVLYLFSYSKASVTYGKDKRFELTREKINIEEYKRILQQKDFDVLYNHVFDARNDWNTKAMAAGFADYERSIKQLQFKSVHKDFQLIAQQQISCFVPVNIPLSTNSGAYNTFSESELKFLKQHHVYPDQNNTISGADIFDLYIASIHHRIDFTQQQIRQKILQGLLSKYIFSIFHTPEMLLKLVHFSDMEKSAYGYQYLSRWIDIYSVEKGLDACQLGDPSNTQFL
ncbi:CRISPR-associated helicase/endonuclease Cas3 [Chitinophaga pendula]|uniref:CRISPR-associated helicase/endonuclease Cas3 n=1 Tax=Chitinophaga TaxID=79328 RepID=UPI000BAFBFAF|nr:MULTISPECIES: CRISPR-associated helicase/endonuclease Cas3 [Chitinophaga]ASZ11934.1 CRISPR-associated protein [Chitinophaga sp. MD30]UCJ05037.1 CRISPR-associated helicase/endonuclease Cas3 [Chitinophaga pendula]